MTYKKSNYLINSKFACTSFLRWKCILQMFTYVVSIVAAKITSWWKDYQKSGLTRRRDPLTLQILKKKKDDLMTENDIIVFN